MKEFINNGNALSHDLVHMRGNKDNYTITESNGTLTYESASLDRKYIISDVEEFDFRYSNGVSDKFKWNSEFEPFDIKSSCLALLNAGNTTDGVYTIRPDGINSVETYCDMTTDGGGWTLIIGAGTAFATTHNFWNGIGGTSENHYYGGETLNTSASEKIMTSLEFTQLLMANSAEKPIFNSSTTSTFVSKKNNTDLWTGGNTVLNNLTWNRTDRDAYTYANFVLGGRTNAGASYGDYTYIGVGATVWPNDLTTAHSWFNGASTGLISGTYHHSIANVHHRSASDNDTFGMFIR